MRDRWCRQSGRAVVAAAMVVAAIGLAGCGVSSQEDPVRVGDGIAAGGGGGVRISPPSPTTASSPEELVRLFFKASAGGGKDAVTSMKLFLTAEFERAWQPGESPQLTVVRLISVSAGVPTPDRIPVNVEYETIGDLSERGKMDELARVTEGRMTFDVQRINQNTSQLRIDRIIGAPENVLLLSDDALDGTYYQAQPIYFWDKTGEWLVPDLRYLPRTIDPEQRPSWVLDWLLDGPSSWLQTSVQPLPDQTESNAAVVSREDKLVVNLSAQAAGSGNDESQRREALRKLVLQLRWSMPRTTVNVLPDIELQIEGQTRDIDSTADVQLFDAAAVIPEARRFAIASGSVVESPASGASQDPEPVLAVAANKNVVAAAISRDLDIAAFVRGNTDRMSMWVARGSGSEVPPARQVTNLPGTSIGRPVVIPNTKGQLLVVADGNLYAVNANNRARDITPDQIGEVQAIAVPPDGRRIAIVAGGKVYVAGLNVSTTQITVGGRLGPILSHQVDVAVAAAWITETNLFVAGRNGNQPALWQVTADGVAADNRSTALTLGSGPGAVKAMPIDLVAHPESPISIGRGEVTVQTDQGAGQVFSSVGQASPVTPQPDLRSPFYAG